MKAVAIAAAATLAMMSTAAFAGGPVLMTDEQLDQVVAGAGPDQPPPNVISVNTDGDGASHVTFDTKICQAGDTCRTTVSVDTVQVTP